MKSAAGHQPNLYPYGGFFAKMSAADVFVIVDTVQYVKKEYHNRNRLKFTDGAARWLSVPVKNAGKYKQLIKDVEIDHSSNWRKDHLRTIEFNYRKAEFFDEFYPVIKNLLEREWIKLADYNIGFICAVRDFLGINTELKIASDCGIQGEARELIKNICEYNMCNTYLHGIHALDYADFDYLESCGIKNLIQIYKQEEYPQLHGSFIPNLSIIDIIFNCGKRSLDIINNSSKIVELKEAEKILSRP